MVRARAILPFGLHETHGLLKTGEVFSETTVAWGISPVPPAPTADRTWVVTVILRLVEGFSIFHTRM